jgi:DNA-binding Lrp family transcriptional regulator
MPQVNLDAIDLKLLATLQANARQTTSELASAVNLSTSPCWRRIKRLEDEGVIEGYRAVLKRRSLGWGVLVFVNVSIEDHSEKEARAFEDAVAALPEVVACWSVAGGSDFLLQVVAQDLDTYADFAMTIIRRLPGIKEMETTFTLKEVKPPTPWPLPLVR